MDLGAPFPASCRPPCLPAGHVLRRLGLPIALSVLPTSAGVLLAVIAAWPTPVTVAAAEVCRKLLAYSLARPARESLYTVLSREEKCELGVWTGLCGLAFRWGGGKILRCLQ